MEIIAPGDLNQVEANQLYLITVDMKTSHRIGQPWRVSRTSGGGRSLCEWFADGPGPPSIVNAEWDASRLGSVHPREG